ncbi:plasmid pRiA4b ORF-3 family protein [Nocardioides sp. JS614]|nr:plasmid pRiA4b ORF-3 family protein [Nocardioides sp. JS614]
MADASPAEVRAVLDALGSGRVSSIFEKLERDQAPTLLTAPAQVRGFRVRLDLHGAKPPVWRRLELPGDLSLPRVHAAIQAAMGWTNSHLHRFRTGCDRSSASFVTQFDVDEGDEGTLEDDVRLDQLLAENGDELWYEYDFGDGWDHVLVVEEVLEEPPSTVRCTGGRSACPPEDCGGLGGYQELAAWVRSGYDDGQLPDVFDDAEDARAWLPLDWHPDEFEVEDADAAVAAAAAELVAVSGELAGLAAQLDRHGILLLRQVLSRPSSHGPIEVADAEAGRLTETYRTFLEVIGDGVALTAAGHLPPAVVEKFAERSGIADWWIRKANREDATPPVANVRAAVRLLGLVSVRKGRLAPTAAAIRCHQDPQALLRHIVERLPVGTQEWEREAGWMALAVAGSGVPAEDWRAEISELTFALGWRGDPGDDSLPSPRSRTLRVLDDLGGAARHPWGRNEGVDAAVAAVARAVTRRA